MKKIIIILSLVTMNNLFAEDNKESISASQLINGCKNSNDAICKTITTAKESLEKTVKDTLPSEISSTTILALKVVTDKGIKVKNPLFKNDHILLQVDKVSYGINFSF